jgi:hypothetical protein
LEKAIGAATVLVPAWVKVRIEEWVLAAVIYKGRLFRPVTKCGKLAGAVLSDEKAIWYTVLKYANCQVAQHGSAGSRVYSSVRFRISTLRPLCVRALMKS